MKKVIGHYGWSVMAIALMMGVALPVAQAQFTLDPGVITNTTHQGGYLTGQPLQLFNAGTVENAPYRLEVNQPWMTVEPGSGTVNTSWPTYLNIYYHHAMTLPPGTHTGIVTILPDGVDYMPTSAVVLLTITPAEVVGRCDPASVTQRFVAGSLAWTTFPFQVWNGGALSGRMEYTVGSYSYQYPTNWMEALPPTNGVSYGEPHTHWIALTNLNLLPEGSYFSYMNVIASNTLNANVFVTLEVLPPPDQLSLTTNRLSCSTPQGARPAPLPLGVWNATGRTTEWTAVSRSPWARLAPSSAACDGTTGAVAVAVDPGGLAPGRYEGLIQFFTDDQGVTAATNLLVELTVTPGTALIEARPSSMIQWAAAGDAARTQQMVIWNFGTGAMHYAISGNQPWMRVSPTSGVNGANNGRTHALTFDSSVGEGTWPGQLLITSPDAMNSPYTNDVLFLVGANVGVSARRLVSGQESAGGAFSNVAFQIWNAGGTNSLTVDLSARPAWIRLSATNLTIHGSQTNTITVSFPSVTGVNGIAVGRIAVQPRMDHSPARPVAVALLGYDAFGSFEEKILFHSARSGNSDIWMINPDGSDLAPLVAKPGTQRDPEISPNGMLLAYREFSNNLWRVVVRDLMTSLETSYTNLENISWMGDNRRLAGNRPGSVGVWILDLANRSLTRAFNDDNRTILWAVDPAKGDMLYSRDPNFEANTAIRVWEAASNAAWTLLPPDGNYDAPGDLAPGGDWVCYPRSVAGNGFPRNLFLTSLETGHATRQLTYNAGSYDMEPDFAPGGNAVACVRRVSTNFVLAVVDVDNGFFSQLLTEAAQPASPDWAWMYQPERGALLQLSTNFMAATLPYASTATTDRVFYTRNAGGGILEFSCSNSAPWMTLSDGAGVSSGEWTAVTATFSADGMASGIHTGAIVVSANATNSPRVITTLLTVTDPDAQLAVAPTNLAFRFVQGGNKTGKYVNVWNRSGGASMSFTAVTDRGWAAVYPSTGTSTGQSVNAYIEVNPVGLSTGFYSGRVSFKAGTQTQHVQLALTVVPVPAPEQAKLRVEPRSFTNQITRTSLAQSQTFEVWNTGGGVLIYRVAETSSWLRILPQTLYEQWGMSQGERDSLTIAYHTQLLPEGVHTAQVAVVSPSGTQLVSVVMNVLPRPRYTLTGIRSPANAGRVTTDPLPDAQGTFEQGLLVRLTAHDDDQYEFHNWNGNPGKNLRFTEVVMRSNIQMTANFRLKTKIIGQVVNGWTNRPIAGARLTFANSPAVFSDAAGHFSFGTNRIPCGGLPRTFTASREGYEAYALDYNPSCNMTNYGVVAMRPAFIRHVRAAQRPGSRIVDVTYDFVSTQEDRPPVSIEFSSTRGQTWDIRPRSLNGDVGPNIPPLPDRRITWDAGTDWGAILGTQMMARVTAAGCTMTSPIFRLDNRQIRRWSVRVWADKNGNDRYDFGEGLPQAPIYYNGRTAANIIGNADEFGFFTAQNQLLVENAPIFSRYCIYSEPSKRSMHNRVDNRLFNLWMDSDIGGARESNWDGTWRTVTFSQADVDSIAAGNAYQLRLNHPVFEFNYLVAVQSASAPFLSQLTNGFASASTYMYDVFDGQAKFGKIAITSGVAIGSAAWTNSDMRIFDQAEYQAQAFGFRWTDDQRNRPWNLGDYIEMGRTWWSVRPDQPDYFRSMVHESGHYLFRFSDEYLNGAGVKWRSWRTNHTDRFPINYGLMDSEHYITELSSINDYPAAYNVPEIASNVTAHVWKHVMDRNGGRGAAYPCWQWMQYTLDTRFSNYNVRMLPPPSGVYANGRSTSADRPGPNAIPAPYTVCDIYQPRRMLRADAEQQEPDFMAHVWRGRDRVAGARLAVRSAQGRFHVPGNTDAQGQLALLDVSVGDEILATWRGASVSALVTADMLSARRADLVFASPAARMGWILATNRLGAVIEGELNAEGVWTMRLRSSLALSNAPVAALWRNYAQSNNLPFTSLSPFIHSASLDPADSDAGAVNLALLAQDGQTLASVDAYCARRIGQSDNLRSPDTHLDMYFQTGTMTGEVPAMVYQYNGPVILPAGLDRTNQVSSLYTVALHGQAAYLASNTVALNWRYDDVELDGVDESTLVLRLWNDAAQSWDDVPSVAYDPPANALSVILTNLGAFALFAGSRADTNPPSAITNLVAEPASEPGRVRLSWTAPGGDGANGSAAAYRLRLAGTEASASDWNAAYILLPIGPQASGASESYELALPVPGQIYYFSIRAVDAAGNLGDPSNLAAANAALDDDDGDGISDRWLDSVNAVRAVPMAADDDADHDGLTTWDEYQRSLDPNSADSDGDGMSDGYEVENNLDPASADDRDSDPDGDTLGNLDEYARGTQAAIADTDGDSWSDGLEVAYGTDPLSYDSAPGSLTVLDVSGASLVSGAPPSTTAGTDFGSLPWGTAITNTFLLTNSGAATLVLNGILTNGQDAFQIGTVPTSLLAGAAAPWPLTFSPQAAGMFTTSITIVNSGPVSNFVLHLAGIAEQRPQTIVFPAIPGQNRTNILQLAATASSGLPVSFLVVSGPAVLTNDVTLSFTGLGQVAIAAAQAGNADWLAAPGQTNLFLVTLASRRANAAWFLLLQPPSTGD